MILTHPPTPNPHIGFNLHTRHTDYDSTVACLALHSLEHMQLHLLFCSNHYCIELHSKTLTVYITVSQYKSYTSISLWRIQFTMCILWKYVYCILCTIVYYLLYIVHMCILLSMYIVHFHILLLVLPWHRVLYLRISPSVHFCT